MHRLVLACSFVMLVPAAVQASPGPTAPPEWLVGAGGYRTGPLAEAAGPGGLSLPTPPPAAVTPAPLPEAYCQIVVEGTPHDTEMDYLPHVIQCENGGANLQALKAQAIAARSVAYYAMAENGGICDGQGCQVYSCGANPAPIHYQAVQETAGQYLSYNNTVKGRVLTYAFFVAGDNDQNGNCHAVDPNASTEQYVTYNEGKTGTNVEETSLGFKYQSPNNYGYGQNRGCMGQWSARCLENNKGYDSDQIIRFFYGQDIEIQTAQGSCVGKPDFAAKYAAQSFPLASQPPVVLQQGDVLDAWIDLTNVGDQTWTQNTKLSPTPRDVASPLAHPGWLSPTRITGPDADTPPDAVGRFSFQFAANAPGDYYQTFGLVEEGVTWFSDPAPLGGGPPDDQLEVHIVVTPAPPDPTTAGGEETGITGDPSGTVSASGTASESAGEASGETGGEPGETGASGEAPTSGEATTTATAATAASAPGTTDPLGDDDDDSGCGCASARGGGLLGLAAPLLVLRRRRRR
ncbi:MAG: hypothetical protein JNL82_30070 [Myxococcales bacterium]|nr:hypothetical protein [Myxococcales bacterium]